jgi:hypothetical protein
MKQIITSLFLFLFLNAFSQTTHVTHSIEINVEQPATCETLSLEAIQKDFFSVYHLSSNKELIISSKSMIDIEKVMIYNLIGQKIKTVKYFRKITEVSINTNTIKEGIYIIRVKTSLNELPYKILIKNK